MTNKESAWDIDGYLIELEKQIDDMDALLDRAWGDL